MSLDELRLAVGLRGDQANPRLEASGGVNLDTVAGIADTGVDFISVGAITHSAKALDLALDFVTHE
jgi:nicotinate-nucleotide pyrophosphorylase (carboxylating)